MIAPGSNHGPLQKGGKMNIKYFDHAATTYVKDEVLAEMFPYFKYKFGNASSNYLMGRQSRNAVEESRNKVAKTLGANTREIYFVSGGTEADNLAIKGFAYANKHKGNHIITSMIEHHAVLNTCKQLEKEGYRVTYISVDSDGIVNLNELEKAITNETILITIMFANNEIGTIQPIEEIGIIARKNNICFHTDAVQAIGNININVNKYKIDMLSLSGHKFYGPKGIGALYVRKGIEFMKIMDGGQHEMDKRSGTENVAGIVGIGKAIELANKNLQSYNIKLTRFRDRYINEIECRLSKVRLNGHRTKRLSGNANMSFYRNR